MKLTQSNSNCFVMFNFITSLNYPKVLSKCKQGFNSFQDQSEKDVQDKAGFTAMGQTMSPQYFHISSCTVSQLHHPGNCFILTRDTVCLGFGPTLEYHLSQQYSYTYSYPKSTYKEWNPSIKNLARVGHVFLKLNIILQWQLSGSKLKLTLTDGDTQSLSQLSINKKKNQIQTMKYY